MPDLSCCVASHRYLAWKDVVGAGSASVLFLMKSIPGNPSLQHRQLCSRCTSGQHTDAASRYHALEPMVNVPLAHTFLGFHEQKESE